RLHQTERDGVPHLNRLLPPHDPHSVAFPAPRDPPDVVLVQPGNWRKAHHVPRRDEGPARLRAHDNSQTRHRQHEYPETDTETATPSVAICGGVLPGRRHR